MRRAWFEQVALHAPFDGVPTFVDRFEGHWQDATGRRWRCSYSPPCLTLDGARTWCAGQGVAVAEVDVISEVRDEFFHTERCLFFGTDGDLKTLDEGALSARSVSYERLPCRDWTVRVNVSLGYDDYVEACRNIAAARGRHGLEGVTYDDIGGRIDFVFSTSAPTEELAVGFVIQAMRHALTDTPDGLGDALGDGFRPAVEVLSPILKRRD